MHDNNCALAASFPELFVTLNRMFYMDTRCGKFYAED